MPAIAALFACLLALLALPAARADTPPESEDKLGGVGELRSRLDSFIAELRPAAMAAGVSARTFARALRDVEVDPTIRDLLTSQPEFVMAPWDYMRRLVSEKRIANGREMLARHKATLDGIEKSIGVDRHVVVAIWGVESSYGQLPGKRSVMRSLATLAVLDQRRPAFWRKELLAALTILERGDITPERMTGSWAGAMGHTQFMPTSFLARAVDHDGDGRRDIWQSVPDALASTARYLKEAGWESGGAWGTEVVLPAGFDFTKADPDHARPLAAWSRLGVEMPFGRTWPDGLVEGRLIMPAGQRGPAFLAGANFRAILRYNNATAYALAVGHLADRLAGQPALAGLWPTDDPPLAREERRELQARLASLGHEVGPIDGIIGGMTRDAVRAWQRQKGLPADGWPGTELLSRLRDLSDLND